MILDIIALTLLAAFFIMGFRKGIIIAIFSLLSFLIGIICALKFSHWLAELLARKQWVTSAWAQLISYVLIFLLVVWLVRLGGRLIEKSIQALSLGILNKLAGGLIYILIAAIIWSSCLWLANQAHLISPDTIHHSKTYNLLLPVVPVIFDHIGAVIPFCKNLFGDLQHFFDQVNKQLPQHVGDH